MSKVPFVDSKLLSSALKGLISRLEKSEKFVLDQAPDICKQMVAEAKMQTTMQMIPGVLFLLAGLVALITSYPHELTTTHDLSGYGFVFAMGVVSILLGVVMVSCATYTLTFLKNCPKLFLVREFSKLVK